ncbi:hypothetical protein KSP40_PGU006442 [Platanthera guangdongensis]|uniref:BPL/LPL catalytic domain-containing protein n=1 Tax=Platanthera guangdongensis TaxID=2320717 RepID=A0ABR2N116_9ASPA
MFIPKARDVGLPFMNLIRMKGFSILQQLHLEERLLRTFSDNWCLINDGTNHPNIVMGISGKPEELIEIELVLEDQVPVIRRFTGGGTVIVDAGTIFVTFICNKSAIYGLQPYPRPIMSWTGKLYEKVFQTYGDFHLRENGTLSLKVGINIIPLFAYYFVLIISSFLCMSNFLIINCSSSLFILNTKSLLRILVVT